MATKKTKKSKGGWFWACDRHSTNFGAYHPDYECCGARSKFKRGFKTEKACRKAAAIHDAKCRMNKPWSAELGGQMLVWQEVKKAARNRKRRKRSKRIKALFWLP